MEKKYILTDETIKVKGHILHRIKAIKSFFGVKVGDLGGYIESETNLSHEGNCWVADNAKAYENSKVTDDAVIFGNTMISGNMHIYGCTQI